MVGVLAYRSSAELSRDCFSELSPAADRRVGLRSEIVSRRANGHKRQLLEQLSVSTRIEIRRDFEALSGKLQP